MQNQKTEWMSQARAAELAEDPTQKVYNYVYDTPTRIWTSEESRDAVNAIRDRWVELRLAKPDAKDPEIRRLIVENPDYKSFYTDHKKIFAFITSRDTTPEQLQHVFVLLYAKQRQEKGTLTETNAQAFISQYLLNSLKTVPSEKETEKEGMQTLGGPTASATSTSGKPLTGKEKRKEKGNL